MTTDEQVPTVAHGHLEPVFVHFEDLDSMGMVHNTRYSLLIERALTRFWDRHGYSYRNGEVGHPDAFVGVAEFGIKYRLPIRGTGDVHVHLIVDRIGETSVAYTFRIIGSTGHLHAEGSRVQIRLDPATLRPAPWGEDTRAIYESLRT